MKKYTITLLTAATLIAMQSANAQVKNDSLQDNTLLDEMVISGTLKPVKRLDSPVPVEVYTPTYFKKNPTNSMLEALQNVNGVRPQNNCNVCNTGDIHINGLEGGYTMVLIDGMPMVSSLGTVYGLYGIPNSMIERIEIVKGPASSLYGSEAVGGLINVITKKTSNAPKFTFDAFTTSWEEHSANMGLKTNIGNIADVLTGADYYSYTKPIDKNADNFTDVTLQSRASLFQKWNFRRKDNKLFSFVGRYLYENRHGGDMRWTPAHRGGDELYAESIVTKRAEIFGNYELPVDEKLLLWFSYVYHDQNSFYGNRPYLGNQKIGFTQLTWDKKIGMHDLLAGASFRYTDYKGDVGGDNEGKMQIADVKEQVYLPGIFIQNEMTLHKAHKLLLGARYDHHNEHGSIFTPRLAYKWSINNDNIIRLNAGTGFKVVNLFAEEHDVFVGGWKLNIDNLKPEKSYNLNLNYNNKTYFKDGSFLGVDLSGFYTQFTNKVAHRYDEDTQTIVYENVSDATNMGATLNLDLNLSNGLKFIVGATLLDTKVITKNEEGVLEKVTPDFSENFLGTWAVSYRVKQWDLNIDYTGNVYSPMSLPLAGKNDPRPDKSPWWSIQNLQFTYDGFDNVEIYAGVKNILDWTPWKNIPFLISNSRDPFDKRVDAKGGILKTSDNPYGLPFDPAYVYAPNQGRRIFLGVRFNIN